MSRQLAAEAMLDCPIFRPLRLLFSHGIAARWANHFAVSRSKQCRASTKRGSVGGWRVLELGQTEKIGINEDIHEHGELAQTL